MIETRQSVIVDVGIGRVWDYVRDIERWADLMPGLQQCTVIDENDSHWVLKVGAGGLVRTVNVKVHVSAWDGPEHVAFTYDLEGDPVQGGGTYAARALGPDQTEVTLQVQVVGSGQMAKMWEAMGKPLLPKFAMAFAQQLKGKIEAAAEEPAGAAPQATIAAATDPVRPSWLARLLRILRGLVGLSARDGAIERR